MIRHEVSSNVDGDACGKYVRKVTEGNDGETLRQAGTITGAVEYETYSSDLRSGR